MIRSPEDETFSAFKRNPTSEHLCGLLSFHQQRAYNLCYQVLRRREDAEDAAQEALIKIVEYLPRIDSLRAFRHWLFRACLTHALNLKRGIHRRQFHESRYVMNMASPHPASDKAEDEKRTAILEALELIEDEQRGLIVEHYFEKTPLEQIATRERVTKGAIWKRMGSARRSLKETMATMGTAAMVPDPSSILEACLPATLSSNLVPRILERLTGPPAGAPPAAHSGHKGWLVTSAVKPLALGGIFMSVKLSTWISLSITAAVLLALGLIVGVLIRDRGTSHNIADVHSQNGTLRSAHDQSASFNRTKQHEGRVTAGTPSTREVTEHTATGTTLTSLLKEYCIKLDSTFPDRAVVKARMKHNIDARQYLRRLKRWRSEQLLLLREQILSEPTPFLDFIKSSTEGDYIESMLESALDLKQWNCESNSEIVGEPVDYSQLPGALTEGLLSLLRSGTDEQKSEILAFAHRLKNCSSEFTEACKSLLFDANPALRLKAMESCTEGVILSESEVLRIRQTAQDVGAPEIACEAAATLGRVRPAGFEDWLFKNATYSTSSEIALSSLRVLCLEYSRRRASDSAFEERLISAMRDSLDRQFTMSQYLTWSFAVINTLPAAKALVLLDAAVAHAPDPRLADSMKTLADAIRSGKTKNSHDRMMLLMEGVQRGLKD